MARQTRKVISPELKREAVRLLEQGSKEAAQLARELGVRRVDEYTTAFIRCVVNGVWEAKSSIAVVCHSRITPYIVRRVRDIRVYSTKQNKCALNRGRIKLTPKERIVFRQIEAKFRS